MGQKILVVDDIALNIEIVLNILGESGCELLTANSGSSALELIQNSQPDLILLDIMMPDIDGFSVLSRIKQHPSTKDIPVIFLTSIDEMQSLIEGFKLGAVDYIKKPFNPYELQARVKAHLELKQARTALEQKNRELQEALNAIKTLEGLIPICAGCKKIRDDDGYWHSVEEYISDHSTANFTHSLCKECIKKLYPDYAEEILGSNPES
ncbi:MAG: hypothetical protein A2087_07465 [Spirochaetes bacterium GWD1_61_31]|nr:MAG: hypothetical protein A2Y37_08005 [Spirochaetes bacterium GWB1_60_80]OHD34249.1 MAG: hypothetical protein A2004_12745 [Spirochaetes bacterium GWC1_61_12]OHD40177.1 MAG: hypothetical protein A2087_07465 [Spirochaetes bacterium GWD1_61_31]OHD45775.1 MAG: hypothetical protein A2Y35_03640 [Spirochaetes bacterium GWE1_60_18]OHD58319.1 MAG: hypothetical protein A2Y32_06030 [Spirochaetes bacterium GWF1_60_12]